MLWSACTMVSLGRDSTHYDTSTFVRRWLLELLMYSHRAYHLPLQQQSTTVSTCTTRCSSGREPWMNSCRQTGDGKKVMRGLIPVQTDLPPAPQELLQVIRCSCKTDCSSLRCTCKKHDIECSVACSNCKGSGCANSFQTECDDDDDDDDETSG